MFTWAGQRLTVELLSTRGAIADGTVIFDLGLIFVESSMAQITMNGKVKNPAVAEVGSGGKGFRVLAFKTFFKMRQDQSTSSPPVLPVSWSFVRSLVDLEEPG